MKRLAACLLLVCAPLLPAPARPSGASGPWTDLGGGLAGATGIPQLSGQGPLAPNTPGSLVFAGAPPQAQSILFFSLLEVPVPFKGGTLSAYPPLATYILVTDASGGLLLPWTSWTPLLPPGLEIFFQAAFADAAAPKGASISNLLRGVTQP